MLWVYGKVVLTPKFSGPIFLNFSKIFLYTLEHPDDSNHQNLFPLDLFHSDMDFYSRYLKLKLEFLEPIFV